MNFLLVVTDDESPWMANKARFWSRRLLRDRGKNFTACRSNDPLCQPTRVGMMSGRWSHRHNVTTNDEAGLNAALGVTFDLDNTFLKWFDTAGYRTGMLGKLFNSDDNLTPSGIDTLRLVNSANEFTANVWNGSTDTAIGQASITYLSSQAATFIGGTEPWCLYLAAHHPHWPWEPTAGHISRFTKYRHSPILETTVTDKPSWIQSRSNVTTTEEETIRSVARGYLSEVFTHDRVLMRPLLAAIDFSDTVVALVSDQGVMLGEHRYAGSFLGGVKNTLYDACMLAPLWIRGPGIGSGVDANPVTHQDIIKTFCDLGSVTPAISIDGQSLLSTSANRELLHHLGDPTGTGADGRPTLGEGITTKTRKLFRWNDTSPSTDEFEMYDLDTDPDELVNVANDGGRLTERNALEAAMDALIP